MKDDELRFEILKLVHAHGRQPHELSDRADALVEYVKTGKRPADPAQTPAKG